MCKISDYPKLYLKAEWRLIHEGIPKDVPGFEILKRAIVIYKVDGADDRNLFFEKVEKGIVIPASEVNFGEDKKLPPFTLLKQWMIEAIAIAGLIPRNQKSDSKTDREERIMLFIEKMAKKL